MIKYFINEEIIHIILCLKMKFRIFVINIAYVSKKYVSIFMNFLLGQEILILVGNQIY